MSRTRKRSNVCDDKIAGKGASTSQGPHENSDYLDHEIAQVTKLKSRPHELLSRDVPGRSRLPVSTMRMLVGREGNYSGRGRFSSADSCHVLSRYSPVHGPCMVDQLNSRAYVSQFSADGTLFITGCQVYASLSPVAHIVNIESPATESLANVTEIHNGLDFSGNDDDDDYDEFGIFSVKFSTDGRELVAASSDNSIYVYDLEANNCSLRVPAHKSDVNTVCFADEAGHLLYSGSDDNLCKVWDRRCFISNGKAAGVLMGHLEGITFIDSRGDGRYFISNGKDQTTKLWDIRKMSSNAKQ